MRYKTVCDNCGMELEIKRFDEAVESFKGNVVKVQSFSCPKCDEKYIIAVFDEESDKLRREWRSLNENFENLKALKSGIEKDEATRNLLKERDRRKRAMVQHNNRLKQRYLKEMKRHGKRSQSVSGR